MANPSDIFASPKRRLARAKQHIRRLEKRISTFFRKKPGGRVTEVDAQGVTIHAFKFNRQIPDSWADAAVEAIEALRSALDQCGYAVAAKAGVAEPKNAHFPFADTVADLDANVKGRCKDLPSEIISLVRFSSERELPPVGPQQAV